MGELAAACYGRDLERDGWPTVSVIMPIRNEAEHLERAVSSILDQEYPIPFDVCIAVGPSDDSTEAIAAEIAKREPRVSIVANPSGTTPAALNAAVEASSGSVVVRVDGHASLSRGYIRTAVEVMARTGAVNVGGIQVPEATTGFESAVAAATTSWLGTGGPRYRVGGAEGPVDTVYLGVFDRAAGDAVGWFAPDLVRNQDYEFNIRLRAAGGVVWFDPRLQVGYTPRGTWSALAKQYFEYGYWKAMVVRRHPGSLQPRQLVALMAPLAAVVSFLLGVRRPRWMVPAAVYACGVVGTVATIPGSRRTRLRMIGVFPTQHFSWSGGFVRGAWAARKEVSAPSTANREIHLCDNYSHLLRAVADLTGRANEEPRPLVLFIDDRMPLSDEMRHRISGLTGADVQTTSDRAAIDSFAKLPAWVPGMLRRNLSWRWARPISPFGWAPHQIDGQRFGTAYVYHPGFFLSKVVAGLSENVVMRDSGYSNYVVHDVPWHRKLLRLVAGRSPIRQVWGEERWIDSIEVVRPDQLPRSVRRKARRMTLDQLMERLDPDQASAVAQTFWGPSPVPEMPAHPTALLVTQPIDLIGICSHIEKQRLYQAIEERLTAFGYHVVVKPHPLEKDIVLRHVPHLQAAFPIEAWMWLGRPPFDAAISLNSAALADENVSFAQRHLQLVPPTRFYARDWSDWPRLIDDSLSAWATRTDSTNQAVPLTPCDKETTS